MINSPDYTSVLLVNEQDEILGTAEKLSVHQTGDLHRAFSVLVFNAQGEFLLQQRALAKYHSGGLWSNTCCGHPSQADNTAAQAEQRLFEEMGFRTLLEPLLKFQYHAHLPNGLIEHEVDHVFIGQYAGEIPFNPDEVQQVRWVSRDALLAEMAASPGNFTAWFLMLMPQLKDMLEH
jgi:isopentenyl-diphosphate delta-isomerase